MGLEQGLTAQPCFYGGQQIGDFGKARAGFGH